MAQIVYSPEAIEHAERAFAFPARHDLYAANAALGAIREAVSVLANHPLLGRRLDDETREFVISFGETGYVALYEFVPAMDEVWILALRHQRELDYPA